MLSARQVPFASCARTSRRSRAGACFRRRSRAPPAELAARPPRPCWTTRPQARHPPPALRAYQTPPAAAAHPSGSWPADRRDQTEREPDRSAGCKAPTSSAATAAASARAALHSALHTLRAPGLVQGLHARRRPQHRRKCACRNLAGAECLQSAPATVPGCVKQLARCILQAGFLRLRLPAFHKCQLHSVLACTLRVTWQKAQALLLPYIHRLLSHCAAAPSDHNLDLGRYVKKCWVVL